MQCKTKTLRCKEKISAIISITGANSVFVVVKNETYWFVRVFFLRFANCTQHTAHVPDAVIPPSVTMPAT